MEAEDQMESFDVTNLFTQVPIDAALEVVEERLAMDTSLRNRTASQQPNWLS